MIRAVLLKSINYNPNSRSTKMSAHQKKLRDFLNFLDREEDLRSILFPPGECLPGIVVVGETSCGKSSLLSSISGIQFPVSTEMCTRCPIRLRMDSTQKSCGTETTMKWTVTRQQVINGVRQQISNILEGTTKETAAAAIVDAHKFNADPAKLMEGEGWIIDVHVRMLDGPNFTLIDLPGRVEYDVSGVPNAIKFYENMVKAYTENERYLVLAVMDATKPIQTCYYLSHVPIQRTVPIMTKADSMPTDNENTAGGLARAKKHLETHNNVFVVRCMSSQEKQDGRTLADVARAEAEFFSGPKVWTAGLEQHRLGVPALRIALEKMYVDFILTFRDKFVSRILTLREGAVREKTALRLADLETESGRTAIYQHEVTNALINRITNGIESVILQLPCVLQLLEKVVGILVEIEDVKAITTDHVVFVSKDVLVQLIDRHVKSKWLPVIHKAMVEVCNANQVADGR